VFIGGWRRRVFAAPASELPDSVRVLLLWLADHVDEHGGICVPRSDMAEGIGRSHRRINDRLDDAVALGWLRRIDPGRPGATARYSADVPPLDGAPVRPSRRGGTWGTRGIERHGAPVRPNPDSRSPSTEGHPGVLLLNPSPSPTPGFGDASDQGESASGDAPDEDDEIEERLEGESAPTREDVTMAAPAVQADPRPEGVAAGGTDLSAPGSPPDATTEGPPRCAHCRFPLDPVLATAEPWHDTHPACDPAWRTRGAA
jgi:hypothetical protein